MIKAQNEGVGDAGWQLAGLLACGAVSFDISFTDHATSAHVQDQPPLIRLLTVVDDLSSFLTKLRPYRKIFAIYLFNIGRVFFYTYSH